MKCFHLIIVLNFTWLSVAGQRTANEFPKLSILVIHPDDSAIDEVLKPFADSIEKKHVDRYYGSIGSLEKLKEFAGEEEKRNIDTEIQGIKLREMEVYDFKYYYAISDLILFDLGVLFNPTYWEPDFLKKEIILSVATLDPSDLFSRDLRQLSWHYQVDYVLELKNVHTVNLADTITSIILKFEATLYSSEDDKVILEEEFIGNSGLDNYKYLTEIYNSRNEKERSLEKRVNCDNYLDCLFKSSARFVSERVYDAIISRAKK